MPPLPLTSADVRAVAEYIHDVVSTARGQGAPPPGPPVAGATVRERVQTLSRLFKYEFRFRADAPFDAIFDETVAAMQESGAIARDPGGDIVCGPGANGASGRDWLELYASVVTNFLEGYRVAARGLGALLKADATPKDLTKKCLAVGNRMFFAGEISRKEAVSKPLVENALTAFVDQGYLLKNEGKLELTDTFRAQTAVATIESKIALFLGQSKE